MSIRKPNVFVIGAPKCGTTTITDWLSSHPDVFISSLKEPNYFNFDEYPYIKNIDDYENLFRGSEDEKWIGEGSTWYMYSDLAVKNILDYAQHPKFIVCLRNPVEMCQSMYYQHRQNGEEYLETFEEAWKVQEEREKGKYISKSCRCPGRLIYGQVCKIGTQLKKVTQIIPDEDLHIIFLDDIKGDSQKVFNEITAFLEIERHHINSAKHNPSQIPRYKSLIYGLNIVSKIKKKLNINIDSGIYTMLKNLNSKDHKPDYNIEIRKELYHYFEDEIRKIEYITGRNLNHWECRDL